MWAGVRGMILACGGSGLFDWRVALEKGYVYNDNDYGFNESEIEHLGNERSGEVDGREADGKD